MVVLRWRVSILKVMCLLLLLYTCSFVFTIFTRINQNPLRFREKSILSWVYFDQRDYINIFKSTFATEKIRRANLAIGQKALIGSVWPDRRIVGDDGILTQLQLLPPKVNPTNQGTKKNPLKKILVWSKPNRWGSKVGQQEFLDDKCNVNTCTLLESEEDFDKADLILFHYPIVPGKPRPPGQIWVMTALEAPLRTEDWSEMNGHINWTASYRHDSTIVTPYEKFVPFAYPGDTKYVDKNYAKGKTKLVAWFVSNCYGDNYRMDYALQLAKYISVDIYGGCGPFSCPRGPDDEKRCFSKLNTDYKFYLSFENANCEDYITEKLFVNGFQHDAIPIVMGASPEDYSRVSPYHSYIHVEEFSSPRELAQYLHLLDSRDDLYNSYFAWKGSGRFINTHFWCRLCALLHVTPMPQSIYHNIQEWWAGNKICIGSSRWTRDS